MATLTSIVADVREILQITAANERLTDAEMQDRVNDALDIYSKDRARILYQEYIGNSEHEYVLPSSWIVDFSIMRTIEWPGGSQVRDFEDQNEIEIVRVDISERTIDSASSGGTSITASTATDAGYFKDGEIVTIKDDDTSETNWITANGNTTSGVIAIKNALANTYDATPLILKQNHLTFKEVEPNATDYFVVEYTAQHLLDDSGNDTIPVTDYNSFSHLAASLCAQSIADDFAKSIDSNFGADSVDHLENAELWRNIMKDHMKIYDNHVGKGESVVTPVSIVRETDVRYSWGRRFLFHGNRTR